MSKFTTLLIAFLGVFLLWKCIIENTNIFDPEHPDYTEPAWQIVSLVPSNPDSVTGDTVRIELEGNFSQNFFRWGKIDDRDTLWSKWSGEDETYWTLSFATPEYGEYPIVIQTAYHPNARDTTTGYFTFKKPILNNVIDTPIVDTSDIDTSSQISYILVSAPSDTSVHEADPINFTVSVTTKNITTYSFYPSGLPDNALFDSLSGNFNWTPGFESAGIHSIEFIAFNDSIADTAKTIITVLNTNRAPKMTGPGNQTLTEEKLFTLQLEASDPDNDSVTISVEDLPSGAIVKENEILWTPTANQSGEWKIRAIAHDQSLSDSVQFYLVVGDVNHPPEFTQPTASRLTIDENEQLVFSVKVSDPDPSDTPEIKMITGPTDATFTSGSFSWTPGFNSSGIAEVVFTASDAELSDTLRIEIEVINVNRAPELNSISNKVIPQGDSLKFTLNATDPDEDDLTFGVSGQPSGATIDPVSGKFTWNPDFFVTPSTISGINFFVTDGTDSDSQTISISITKTNRAPIIEGISDQEIDEGDSLSIPFVVSDPDQDNVTISLQDEPEGMVLNFQDAKIQWNNISYADEGYYIITLLAKDGQDSSSMVFTLNVNDVKYELTIDQPSHGTISWDPLLNEFDPDVNVTIYANAYSGYHLDTWSGGTLTGNHTPKVLTMDGPKTIGAVFIPDIPEIGYIPNKIKVLTNEQVEPHIPFNTGGPVSNWSIAPTLPNGMAISPENGTIQGTPTDTTGPTLYTITASNATGSDQVSITIETSNFFMIAPNTFSYAYANTNDTINFTWKYDPAFPFDGSKFSVTILPENFGARYSACLTDTTERQCKWAVPDTLKQGSPMGPIVVAPGPGTNLPVFIQPVDEFGYLGQGPQKFLPGASDASQSKLLYRTSP